MRTVHKFPFEVTDESKVYMARDAKILRVEARTGEFGYGHGVLWAEVDTDQPMEARTLYCRGTGHALPEIDDLSHVASYAEGPFMWHIYQRSRNHDMPDHSTK